MESKSEDKTAIFLITGPAHLPYAVVVLRSLRRHFNGRVILYAWPQSYGIAKEIGNESTLGVEVRERKPTYTRKNAQEIDKMKILIEDFPNQPIIYLDADLLIMKPIHQLADMAENVGFCAVQFCDWYVKTNGVTGNRVKRMLGVEGIDQECVRKSLLPISYSVNSGVFAACDTDIVEQWLDWTQKCKHIFIAGETALHAIIQRYEPEKRITVAPGYYNCSAKYQAKTSIKEEDVAIWHFHGDSAVRPKKTEKGLQLWWPEYQACLSDNVGGIADWKDSCNNEFIESLEKSIQQ